MQISYGTWHKAQDSAEGHRWHRVEQRLALMHLSKKVLGLTPLWVAHAHPVHWGL